MDIVKRRKRSPGQPRKSKKLDSRAPNSMGWVLMMLRLKAGLTQEEMASVLNATPGRFGTKSVSIVEPDGTEGKREEPIPFRSVTVSKCEQSMVLELWQLIRYANWSGLPVGAINLVQQLGSHIRDIHERPENKEVALAIAQATKTICDFVISELDPVGAGKIVPRPLPTSTLPPDVRDACIGKLSDACDAEIQRLERLLIVTNQLLDLYPESARKTLREHAKQWTQDPPN